MTEPPPENNNFSIKQIRHAYISMTTRNKKTALFSPAYYGDLASQPRLASSRAFGKGLLEATTRQPAYFTIESFDADGNRKAEGGDSYLVSIRGPSQPRARVTDNGDGTYTAAWKPYTSGSYSISVSQNGLPLPDTPFVCSTLATMPCAANCIVRGDHLSRAISRTTHHFEVLFKDVLGQITYAVDLDVYVEPVSPEGPRHRAEPPKGVDMDAKNAFGAPDELEEGRKKKKTSKLGGKSSKSKDAAQEGQAPSALPVDNDNAVVVELEPAPAVELMTTEMQPSPTSDVATKHRMMRVQVKDKPLLVRATAEKSSLPIGRIMPGNIVTILEERIAPNGEVRASIDMQSVALSVDGGLPTLVAPLAAGSEDEGGDAGDGTPMGWVTLVKNGKKLVSSRVKLDPATRHRFSEQWARRKANDKAASYRGGVTENELKADPSGVGFGFGGVEPGTLHAKGQLHEVHRVSYSIGCAGEYLLHVRLRQKAIALPGSPFSLVVKPGAAYAKSTTLAPLLTHGVVGMGPEHGVNQELKTSDKMANACIVGGAEVRISSDYPGITSEVIDNGDGSYRLEWRCKVAGTFTTRVMVNNEEVIGSPTTFSLFAASPEIGKSELFGDGLRMATAGMRATVKIKFVDEFDNVGIPSKTFKFGLSLGKDKDKLANVSPHDFIGTWETGNTGIYEMK